MYEISILTRCSRNSLYIRTQIRPSANSLFQFLDVHDAVLTCLISSSNFFSYKRLSTRFFLLDYYGSSYSIKSQFKNDMNDDAKVNITQ